MTDFNAIHPLAAASTDTAILLTKGGEIDRRQFNPGRPEGTGVLDDKWGKVEALGIIAAKDGFYHYADKGAPVSRMFTLKLVDAGFVETHKVKVTDGPGRAKKFYKLTGKGRSYLALSKNWKRPAE